MTDKINGNKFIRWPVFKWTIGVVLTLIFGAWGFISTVNMTAQDNRVDIRENKTILKSIDENVKEIKEDLKNLRR